MENEADDEDGDYRAAGINERNGEGAGDILGHDARKATNDVFGFFGGACIEVAPELFDDAGAFSKHKEGEYEHEDAGREEAADGSDGIGDSDADVIAGNTTR